MANIRIIVSHCVCRDTLPAGASTLLNERAYCGGHRVMRWSGTGKLEGVDLVVALFHPRSGPEWGGLVASAVYSGVQTVLALQEKHRSKLVPLIGLDFMATLVTEQARPIVFTDETEDSLIPQILACLEHFEPQPA